MDGKKLFDEYGFNLKNIKQTLVIKQHHFLYRPETNMGMTSKRLLIADMFKVCDIALTGRGGQRC
jgi:hypothetical protein